jgi:hypothetical protein
MRHRWFKAWGWIYRPASWQGVAVILLALAFSVQVFLAVDARSHSVSDTLYGIFPFIVPCWMIVYWVATKTAASER